MRKWFSKCERNRVENIFNKIYLAIRDHFKCDSSEMGCLKVNFDMLCSQWYQNKESIYYSI